jgi:hypothetical protein
MKKYVQKKLGELMIMHILLPASYIPFTESSHVRESGSSAPF